MNPPTRQAWRGTLLVFVAALLLHGLLEAWVIPSDRPGSEGFLHARWAERYAAGAVPWTGLAFPWLPYTSLAFRPVDLHWGWHWLAAPFAASSETPIDGFRVFLAVQAAFATAAVHHVLAMLGARRPILWTGLLLPVAAVATLRLHSGHAAPAQAAGALLAWALLVSKRPLAGGVALGATMLAVHTPELPLVAALSALAGIAWSERRLPWREGYGAAAGLAAAVLLHPGFHDARGGLLSLDRGTIAALAARSEAIAFSVGGAVISFSDGVAAGLGARADHLPLLDGSAGAMRHFVMGHGAALAATVIAAFAALPRSRTPASAGAAVAAVWTAWLATGRAEWIDAWGPFALVAAALAVAGPASPVLEGTRLRNVGIAGGAALLLAILPFRAASEVRGLPSAREIAPAMAAVVQRAQPGDMVFTGDWSEFGPLWHEAPDLRFPAGIDPHLAVARDTALVRAAADVRSGTLAGPVLEAALVRRLAVRFVVLWRRPYPDGTRASELDVHLVPLLRDSRFARVIHDDPAAIAFELE
ncbi:MAG: hypothetical protein HMLKMBBP_02147 [Planctomycetes bacterium]|nr:hypothetical protein [Planctomycetota bacterium]